MTASGATDSSEPALIAPIVCATEVARAAEDVFS
jgi:hypothetical protein